MRFSLAASLALAGVVAAVPAPNPTASPGEAGSPVLAARAPIATNPFAGKTFYANEFYASEVRSAAAVMATGTNSAYAAKASTVANIGTFMWM